MDKITQLKEQIGQELQRVPSCVLRGGVMMSREYRLRAESATKLLGKSSPKESDLQEALYLLRTIDKYVPRDVPMTAQGRLR